MLSTNVGIDIGFGFLKATDGRQDLVFPSVVGLGQRLTYYSELTLHVNPEDNLVVEVDGQSYFVGNLAIRQSEILSRSLMEDRPADLNARILFLTALGMLAERQGGAFHVVTGLPPGHYLSYKDSLHDMVVGGHRVTFVEGDRRLEKHLLVEQARVIPQPFGTVFDLLLDPDGTIRDRELALATIGIIDIGFRTADFVVADRLEYIDRLSFSNNMGLVNAYDLIAAGIRREFRITKENYELDAVVAQGKIRVEGKTHDIREIREEAYEQVARKIITEVNSRWTPADLDAIYITGGGGQALSPYLLKAFGTARVVSGAQSANVRGYWKLANKLYRPKADGAGAAPPSSNGVPAGVPKVEAVERG